MKESAALSAIVRHGGPVDRNVYCDAGVGYSFTLISKCGIDGKINGRGGGVGTAGRSSDSSGGEIRGGSGINGKGGEKSTVEAVKPAKAVDRRMQWNRDESTTDEK